MDLAITNLLENAIKYTPEHGKIGLTAEAGDAFIKVRIKDNGVGIPKNDLPWGCFGLSRVVARRRVRRERDR